MKESASPSPSPMVAAAAGGSSSNCRHVYHCHGSLEHQAFSKITFRQLTLVAAYFRSPGGIMAFWMLLHIYLIVLPYMVQSANKVMNQRLYVIFNTSGHHPIIIPPLLKPGTAAPDATGPSLSGGPNASPSRRVSGLNWSSVQQIGRDGWNQIQIVETNG